MARSRRSRRQVRERRRLRAGGQAGRSRGRGSLDEVESALETLFASETAVEQTAALVLERVGRERPVPVGLAEVFARAGSEERARAIAEEVGRLAAGSVCALSLAADLALRLDGDPARAGALLEQARAAAGELGGEARLAEHFLALGRLAEAVELVRPLLLADPGDAEAIEVYGAAVAAAHERALAWAGGEDDEHPGSCPCGSGRAWLDCCSWREEDALFEFVNREEFDALRQALAEYVEYSPPLAAAVAASLADWRADLDLEEVELVGDPELGLALEQRRREEVEALARLGLEHAWLLADAETEDEDADAAGVDDDDEVTPLGVFAADPATPPALAAAARRWREHCHYGLWQVADATPAPGMWCTEILTGVRRYVAVPDEQMEGLARWGVLLGALVPDGLVWRSGGALVVVRPSEADMLAELVEQMVEVVAGELAGRRARRRSRRLPRPGRQRPFGVLVHVSEPAAAEAADLYSKVVSGGLARLIGELRAWRAASPKLANTDGDPLCLITAFLEVADPAAVAATLAARPEFEQQDREDQLSWWGRELSALEQAGALTEVAAQLKATGSSDAIEERPTRWLRGHIRVRAGGLLLEVNSRQRLERFCALLAELGVQASVSEQTVFDPALDLPPIRRGTPLPFGASAQAITAWLSHWPDQPLPTLAGLTPRRAASQPVERPILEALLREFEHDADLLDRHQLPAPDLAALRADLDMPAAAWTST